MIARVLVIDDDVALAETIAETLADEGYDPLVRTSGEDGLQALRHERVDLVIVDHHLGGMTGADFTRASRSSAPDIPVIGISGRFGTEQALMAAGACCFIQKPFDRAHLAHALRWVREVYLGD